MSLVIRVKRGDLEYIRSSIEVGELDRALEVLEEILKKGRGG